MRLTFLFYFHFAVSCPITTACKMKIIQKVCGIIHKLCKDGLFYKFSVLIVYNYRNYFT